MNAPVSKTKYPPLFPGVPAYAVPLLTHSSSLSLCFSLPTLKPHHGLTRPAQDKFCLHQDGGEGRRAWTKDAFIAVGSGWLQIDNGHILQLQKQIAVCSLALLWWTKGGRSGRARFLRSGLGWWREKSVAPRGGSESCRGGQNKATKAKIALRDSCTSNMEVSVSDVFVFALTPVF